MRAALKEESSAGHDAAHVDTPSLIGVWGEIPRYDVKYPRYDMLEPQTTNKSLCRYGRRHTLFSSFHLEALLAVYYARV